MKATAYIAGLLGLCLFAALLIRANGQDILHVAVQAGWRPLWLVPYRAVFFLLYALGWQILLRPADPDRRASFGYLLWLTSLREAIDRLLPVASVGGAIVAVRLAGQRGLSRVALSVSVICEILLTLWASYLFALLGFLLALTGPFAQSGNQAAWIAILCALPVPVVTMALLRRGRLFSAMQATLGKFVGIGHLADGALNLDRELRAALGHYRSLLGAGALELLALVSASVEIWLAMRWFGHPIDLGNAVILEAATQAVRHVAFFLPAALGVQEAGLVAFGHFLGISPELALSVSIVKRLREIVCGLPCLAAWQWLEWKGVSKRAGSAWRLQ